MCASFDDFKWLRHYTPCFQTHSSNIEILQEPNEFHRTLKSLFSSAKNRICISSLYLGTGHLEQQLVDSLKDALETSPYLNVKILLDHSRGLRGEKNSKTMLEKLISERLHLYLYHTPNLRGILKRLPHRYNETIGVLHMKIYIADDTLVISGANLSNDYFVNRQDRYMVIKNCSKLCDFFEKIIECVSEFSFKVDKSGVVTTNEHENHPFEGSKDEFSRKFSLRLTQEIDKFMLPQVESDVQDKNQALIYPLLQIYDANLTIDEQVTKKFFKECPSESELYLAAGYFNLTHDYERIIVEESRSKYNLLISSPEANGFFGSTGFSKHVPSIYTYVERQFHEYYTQKSQEARIQMFEYRRTGWTYHAKGVWYYAPNAFTPNMTIIGSSNFGYRSVYRDLEAQLLIHSDSQQFAEDLKREQEYLFAQATQVNSDTFANESRMVPIGLRLLTRLIRSFF